MLIHFNTSNDNLHLIFAVDYQNLGYIWFIIYAIIFKLKCYQKLYNFSVLSSCLYLFLFFLFFLELKELLQNQKIPKGEFFLIQPYEIINFI